MMRYWYLLFAPGVRAFAACAAVCAQWPFTVLPRLLRFDFLFDDCAAERSGGLTAAKAQSLSPPLRLPLCVCESRSSGRYYPRS